MDLVTVSARTQLVALLLKIVVCTVELASSVDVGLCSNNGTMDNGQTVLLDGRCYALVKVEDKISWEDANIACLELGGYLASLNTEDEWDSVTNFIRGRSSGKPPVFVGLKLASPVLPNIYRGSLVWTDHTVAYYTNHRSLIGANCGWIGEEYFMVEITSSCNSPETAQYLCELDSMSEAEIQNSAHLRVPVDQTFKVAQTGCPAGHVTHAFLACDQRSECWVTDDVTVLDAWGVPTSGSCGAGMTSLPPSFTCANGAQHVAYTLVCDHRQDCTDGSDETFCVFPPCGGSVPLQCGVSKQCLPWSVRCDGQKQCVDGTDEDLCAGLNFGGSVTGDRECAPPPPALVNFDPTRKSDLQGRYSITLLGIPLDQPANYAGPCPETHFQCPDDGYCLPVYLRCNGVNDCPGKQDEVSCSSYSCPGFYRCRNTKMCLHASHVCDGLFQCPQQDDELFCGLKCPESCTCYGLAFRCRQIFPADQYPDVRYLDASGSGMTPERLSGNLMLIHLGLAKCNLTHVNNLSFPNLHSLDLSDNHLSVNSIDVLSKLPRLKVLSLAGNTLLSLFAENAPSPLPSFPFLVWLDLSRTEILGMNTSSFEFSPHLQSLNLTDSGLKRVVGAGFQSLKQLQFLDMRACPVSEFPRSLFQGLDNLQAVYADNYKLCCPVMLPVGFNTKNCLAPFDEISSCDALLRADIYRVALSVFAILALAGNVGSIVFRTVVRKDANKSGFGVFVTHLAASDCLMGVYLSIIGVADRLYLGTYVWEDAAWKRSTACQVAGFLSLVSSEVSALIICLITLERFLVLSFPFSRVHFYPRSAHFACFAVWALGVLLAALPLLPVTSHWEFYSQTGICIPLPITKTSFHGHDFAFGVMIVFNFVLFLLIAVGQASIYFSVRANSMAAATATAATSKKSQDTTVARRLITIAVTDFLCWFPVGFLGLLASRGTPIPGEVNVTIAIAVLPLNAAINPFLYTLNLILERRRKNAEEKLLKAITDELSSGGCGRETL